MKKIFLIFTLSFFFSSMYSTNKDTVGRKILFGMQAGISLYSEKIYREVLSVTQGKYNKYSEKILQFKPNLDAFFQYRRLYLSIGIWDVNQSNDYSEIYIPNGVNKNEYKFFTIGFSSRVNFIVVNPKKYFLSPYLGLGLNYSYYKETWNKTGISTITEKSYLYNYLFSIGLFKEINEKIYIKLGASGNFLMKGKGHIYDLDKLKETGIFEFMIGYRFIK